MSRYVEDGPPIPLPSREEMLAADLPFELRTESVWFNVRTRSWVHEPLIVRFATAEARDAWRSR